MTVGRSGNCRPPAAMAMKRRNEKGALAGALFAAWIGLVYYGAQVFCATGISTALESNPEGPSSVVY